MHVESLINALATGAFKKEKNVVQNTRKPGRQEQQVSTQTMKQSWCSQVYNKAYNFAS